MNGQISIFDLLDNKLADNYDDGIPPTIEEVVQIIEERTGLKFKRRPDYKSIIGVYIAKYKKVEFETSLGRYVPDVRNGHRYIDCSISGTTWGRANPKNDIDSAIATFKRWKNEIDEEYEE